MQHDKIIGETDRIVIRPWQDGDERLYHEVSQDAGLNEFIVFRYKTRDVEDAKKFVDGWRESYRATGRGVFPVFTKGGEMMGVCALRSLRIDGETADRSEIMYRLAEKFWRKGHATEIAGLLLQYAKSIGAADLIGLVNAENTASKTVLRKVGMELTGNVTYKGFPFHLFQLK